MHVFMSFQRDSRHEEPGFLSNRPIRFRFPQIFTRGAYSSPAASQAREG
jgi:hypothetical protein